jgi:phosphoribosylformylglycinamidine cyclo-ligase
MTYKGSGVDYEALDPFKRMAQEAGRATAPNALDLGFIEVEWSRGESCYLMRDKASTRCIAQVHEGLGTKNLIAEAMYGANPIGHYYCSIAQDAVAMGVNDMITLGAFPVAITMHLAVGSGKWFAHKKRTKDLIDGWVDACHIASCVWSGGETPTLKDIIAPETMELSCSVFGRVELQDLLSPKNVRQGDAIVLLESSGVHANGITLCREIASKLRDGYLTPINGAGSISFGAALLAPTTIYVPILKKILETDIDIHYGVNITGHGWRKLMRAWQPLAYVISCIPEPQPVFGFISDQGNISTAEMYANYNMGAGFAIYVGEKDVGRVIALCQANRIEALYAGHVEKSVRRRVAIMPLGIEYEEASLAIR